LFPFGITLRVTAISFTPFVITFPYILIVVFIYSATTEKQWVYAGLQTMPDYYSAIKLLFSTLH
ncbi:hypothetical protein, partial [Enterobacter asburiae]|uniref:hypothetical protein n=1 Tax=Enterobacter asburiae TaxID=61645 RepID=UPI001C407FA7